MCVKRFGVDFGAKKWIVPILWIAIIPETTNPAHLRENLGALKITWTKDEMAAINKRLGEIKLYGERYAPNSDAARSVWNLI